MGVFLSEFIKQQQQHILHMEISQWKEWRLMKPFSLDSLAQLLFWSGLSNPHLALLAALFPCCVIKWGGSGGSHGDFDHSDRSE